MIRRRRSEESVEEGPKRRRKSYSRERERDERGKRRRYVGKHREMKDEKDERRRRRKTKQISRQVQSKKEGMRKLKTTKMSPSLRLRDPLSVSVRSFSSNVSLEGPLEHGRPGDISIVLLEDIVVPSARFRLLLGGCVGKRVDGCFDGSFGGRNAVGVERREGAGGEESFSKETFSSKEATSEIGEVSRWVEGKPPGRGRRERERVLARGRSREDEDVKGGEREAHQLLW